MQCPTCGAIEPDNIVECHRCGARLLEGAPYFESTWAEYGGVQEPVNAYGSRDATVTSLSPIPGGYTSSSNYSYIADSMPLVIPAPKNRGLPLAVIIMLGILVLLLISGGVFVGVGVSQSHSGTAAKQSAATSIASSSPDANQLYQQVTSQKPTFVDTLQNALSSSWSVFEKPKYGCEIKSDGLHVHISDTSHYTYCTSGRGKLSNFAFQVEMRILSGEGGGILFRDDTQAGNGYFFHVYSEGSYRIYLEQNHHLLTAMLADGAINSFAYATDQKNTLTVIAQNSQIYLYDNQQLITKIQDTTYASGYLGVSASDYAEPAEVIYTNAQIWVL